MTAETEPRTAPSRGYDLPRLTRQVPRGEHAMDLLEQLRARFPDEVTFKLVMGAIGQKALLYNVDGHNLAAARCESLGWWVWKLEPGAEEHFVNSNLTRCNCEAFRRGFRCVHIRALTGGGTSI